MEDNHGNDRPRVVIVGGGFGGLAAARALKGAPADVTLIDRRNHHLFQPLLYQVATAALAPSDVATPIRVILRKQVNVRVLMDTVTSIDPAAREVRTASLTIPYDHLVLATGSSDDYFGHSEWASHALGLKSLEDALDIRYRILSAFERAEATGDAAERRRLMTFVLIGGGPTGVEMAGALAELAKRVLVPDFRDIRPQAARIVLVEGADRLLGGFRESQQRYAREALEKAGVEVRLSTMAEAIDADGVTAGGTRIPASTVIWAAGQRACAPLGTWLGTKEDKGGRVSVAPDLTLDSHPGIRVIGDTALCPAPSGEPLPGLAAVALQQGRYVGRAIKCSLEGRRAPGPFRYRNWGTMATIGRAAAVADFGFIRLSGNLAWWLWGAVHIYSLVGFRNRASVLLNWLWTYVTLRRGAQVIIPRKQDGRAEQTRSSSQARYGT